MNNTSKSVVSASSVIVSVAAVVFGVGARQRADLGVVAQTGQSKTIVGLLASRSDDVNVPAGDYFYELSQKLKSEYVEPVTDDQKLATGAIRGMVVSLNDPQSQFMDKNQFAVFLNARAGKFEGIGAEFAFVDGTDHKQAEALPAVADGDSPEDSVAAARSIPRLEVVTVVPGGPADRAQVKPGDIVNSVDGHWVVNADLVQKFRDAQRAFLQKKTTLDQLNVLRNELRSKTEHAIFPQRAQDMLFMGTSGTTNVVWDRGSVQRLTRIVKGLSVLPGFSVHDDVIKLLFLPGSDADLAKAVSGKRAVTIDLRDNALGDPACMRRCLAILAPDGQYGDFATFRHESPTPLVVKGGNPHPPKTTLLVDGTTRGVAEMFALALSSHGLAKLSGGSMGGDLDNRAIFHLPDGTGYTLVTSIYEPKPGAAAAGRLVHRPAHAHLVPPKGKVRYPLLMDDSAVQTAQPAGGAK